MSDEVQIDKNAYEVSLRILGNEVFAVKLRSSSDSNRWVFIGLLTAFCSLTLLGAYGEKLVNMFKGLV